MEIQGEKCGCGESEKECKWLPKVILKDEELKNLPKGFTKKDMIRYKLISCKAMARLSLDLFICPTLRNLISRIQIINKKTKTTTTKRSVNNKRRGRKPIRQVKERDFCSCDFDFKGDRCWRSLALAPITIKEVEAYERPKVNIEDELNLPFKDSIKFQCLRMSLIAIAQYDTKHGTKYKIVEAIKSHVDSSSFKLHHCVYTAVKENSCVPEMFFAHLEKQVHSDQFTADVTLLDNDTKITYDGCDLCIGFNIPHPATKFPSPIPPATSSS